MVDIIFPKSAKKYMELQCNGVVADYTECPELESIDHILTNINPKNVLEVGAGLGRVSVFMNKKYKWNQTNFFLLDGNSGDQQIAGLHENVGKDFYNSLDATREFCNTNGIGADRLKIINAENSIDLTNLQFDLCYSFKSIGFHWPINWYLEKLHVHILPKSYLFFEIRDTRRESYPTEKHWKRRVNFVQKQINNIAPTKYAIINANTLQRFPILTLRKY
jgi:hypothetical protein